MGKRRLEWGGYGRSCGLDQHHFPPVAGAHTEREVHTQGPSFTRRTGDRYLLRAMKSHHRGLPELGRVNDEADEGLCALHMCVSPWVFL